MEREIAVGDSMMATIQSSLLDRVRGASLEEKAAIANELIRDLAAFDESPIVGVPIHVTDEMNRTIGVYYPVDPDEYAKHPPMTSEEALTYLLRMDAIDRDSISQEEMVESFKEELGSTSPAR
jgi:hypothetical protein